MNVLLVLIEEEEVHKIGTMARKIWNEYYPKIIGQKQVDYMLSRFYNDLSLTNQMREGQNFYLIMDGSEALGYISVSIDPLGNGFIHKFYIDSHRRKKGIGSAAFEQLQHQFPQLINLKLQVNRQNIIAINFYFKMGFTIQEAADFDIGNGYFMNDFVMVRTF